VLSEGAQPRGRLLRGFRRFWPKLVLGILPRGTRLLTAVPQGGDLGAGGKPGKREPPFLPKLVFRPTSLGIGTVRVGNLYSSLPRRKAPVQVVAGMLKKSLKPE